MYTRCPSIANIFQKAILLKETKCNKIIHRQIRSESLLKSSKNENKFKPTKRYFSGGNNRNSMQKLRNIQGVGFVRKSLPKKIYFIPKWSREIGQQEPLSIYQQQYNPEIVGHPGQPSSGGKITIVIDKNKICNCSLANEDLQIHVTTTPELPQPKRLIDALSDADISQICSTKCSCCKQCNEAKNLRVQQLLPMGPVPNTLQQSSSDVNYSNRPPRPQRNFYGIPLQTFPGFDGRSMKTDLFALKKNRSMSEFPAMRKMVVPETFQPNIGQQSPPMKMQQSPLVNNTRSQNGPFPMPRTMGPNVGQMQRRLSFHSQPAQLPISNQIVLPKQQTSEFGTVFERQPVKSYPINVLEREKEMQNKKRIEEPIRPVKSSINNLNIEQSIQQPQTEIGRSGTEIDKSQKQSVRVIRPATFSSTNTPNGSAAVIDRVKLAPVLNQRERALELFHGPFLRKPNLFNIQQTASKNKFPVGRQSVPKMTTFHSPSALNPVQRSYKDNVSERISRGELRSSFTTPSTIARANTVTNHSAQIPPQQRSSSSISHENSSIRQNMVNQQQFLVQQQPPPMVFKKRAELQPALNQILEIKNRQPPNVQQTHLPHPRQRSATRLSTHRINSISPKEQLPPIGLFGRERRLINPPQAATINKFPVGRARLASVLTEQRQNSENVAPGSRTINMGELGSPLNAPRPNNVFGQQTSTNQLPFERNNPMQMPAYRMSNLSPMKQPPQVFLKRRSVRRPAASTHPKIKRQPSQRRNSSLIPVPRNRNPSQRKVITDKQQSAREVQPKIVPHFPNIATPTRSSRIPVGKTFSVPKIAPRTDFSLQNQTRTGFTGTVPRPAPSQTDFSLQNQTHTGFTGNVPRPAPPRTDFSLQNQTRTGTTGTVPRPAPPRTDFSLQNQTRTGTTGTVWRPAPVVPFERLVYPAQSNNKIDSTKPWNLPRTDRRQKRSDIQRINGARLQSSLPVTIMHQPNQIEKYVEHPKSMQIVGRPNSNQANIRDTIPGSSRDSKDSSIPENSIRFQQMPQLRQMTPPMTVPKTLPQEQPTTQSDKPNEISPNLARSEMATPKVDKSNLGGNPAVLFYAPGKLKLVNIPVPRLADENGVIVKMLYVHLTDTDALMLSSIQDGPYKLTKPTIAGKSGSGIIVDAGKEVESVKIGDKVSVKGVSCGKCTACENDNEVICERVPITEKLGILKRFHSVSAKFVTRLPDAVHPIDGAMIDELSSAIQACKKATVTAGDHVLVLGGKSLGLWTALAAKSLGATKVCLADCVPMVVEQAKKLGIKRVFLINPNSSVSSTSTSIAEYMDGEKPRIVFDCNGSALSNELAINTSLIGGKVVLMKNSLSNQPIVLTNAVDRGIDILCSQHGNNTSERAAVKFLASGKVQLNGIDSSFFNISDVHEAFGLLTAGTISNIFVQPSRLDDGNVVKTKSKTS